MILRERDWGFHPGAIVHDTTENEHFLKFASTLQALGVKHYYPHLALHNPKLLGVNPRELDITNRVDSGWCTLCVDECAVNPWYFFREAFRVPSDGNEEGDKFKLDRGNFALLWGFFNNIDVALEFLRQHGKTVGLASLESWLIRFLEKSRVIHITRGPILREETITKLKEIRKLLPDYLWPLHPDDPDNKESFACTAKGNKLITAIGQPDPMSANGVGRGLTSGRIFSDEGPFTKNIQIILPAALGSSTKARQINEANGTPYGNIFATTCGDLADKEGQYMYNLMTSGILWDERYLDVPTREELLELIMRNGRSENREGGIRRQFYVKFNHRQLGTTDAQLAEMITNATGTPDQIRRDYGGEWTTGGLNKPYSEDDARRMNESKMRPDKEIGGSGYIVNWFYDPSEKIKKMRDRHVIGIDSSEAVGRDEIYMVMVNSATAETAATAGVNETNVIGYANWLAEFLLKYENTVLIIERKSTGGAIIDAVLLVLQNRVRDLHKRIYVSVTQDRGREDELYREFTRGPGNQPERFWSKFRKMAGFATDADKRRKLYGEVFTMALRLAADHMRDPTLIQEVLALVSKNGRIDHQSGGHDDAVIAWLLAMWLIIFGKNVSHYEINNSRLMIRKSNLLNRGEHTVDEEAQLRHEEEQAAIMMEVENLVDEIMLTRSPIIQMKLKNRLQMQIDLLDTDFSNVASMETLKELIQRRRMKQ